MRLQTKAWFMEGYSVMRENRTRLYMTLCSKLATMFYLAQAWYSLDFLYWKYK